MDFRSQLIDFEGFEHKAYPDPLTHGDPWTIGVGHTGPEVCEGLVWTDAQIGAALDADIAECLDECTREFPWFSSLEAPRQAVIAGMSFQMGMHRLLGFSLMLGAVRDERYPQAANQMRNSIWARQTPKRAVRLAAQMDTGEWQ